MISAFKTGGKRKTERTTGSISSACSFEKKGTGMNAKRARKYATKNMASHRETRVARVIL